MFGWIVVVLAAAYAAGLMMLRRGIGIAYRDSLTLGELVDPPRVTVLVPARNEAERIGECVRALVGQDYPPERLEIVVIDDRSEDDTGEVARRAAGEAPHVRVVRVERVPKGIAPKKHALEVGIREASGELILTTDADCVPPPTWVRAMARLFDGETGAVLGFSPLVLSQLPGWVRGLYRLDSLALASLAAGGVGLGYPLTCSGRNFGYRKRVYHELGGFGPYAAVASGDDDLLLARIRDETKWRVRYAFAPESHVPAAPVTTLRAFWNQRARHASKGLLYPRRLRSILIAVYLFNVGFLALTFQTLLTGEWIPYGVAWLLKAGSELGLLARAGRSLNFPAPLWLVPVVSVLHSVYVVLFGLVGQLRSFEWKGQAFHRGGRT